MLCPQESVAQSDAIMTQKETIVEEEEKAGVK